MSDLEKIIKQKLESYDFHLYPEEGVKVSTPFVAKEDLVFSGKEVFETVFLLLDDKTKFSWYFEQGDLVLSGQTLCLVESSFSNLLKAKKLACQLIGHLSGLATYVRQFKNQTLLAKTKVLLSPLEPFDFMEKKALLYGGGVERESFLVDLSLIQYYSSLTKAVVALRAKKYCPPLSVQVSQRQEVEEALSLSVESLFLDKNTLKSSLDLLDKTCVLELSVGDSFEEIEKLVKEFKPHFICPNYRSLFVRADFVLTKLERQNFEAYL